MALNTAKVSLVHLGKVVRVSERIIPPMKEVHVREAMLGIHDQIKGWPGLLNIETLVDTEDPRKHIVVTEWESRKHMKYWLKSDLCKQFKDELDKVLDTPATYRELMHHEDDVFLL